MSFNLLTEPDAPVAGALDDKQPVLIYEEGEHAIYWLGISEETVFRCNAYLIKNGNEAILVDPGGSATFNQVKERASQIVAPEKVTGMILCHQDPDVAGSMVQWIDLNKDIRVFSTPRTHVLLPHYGRKGYNGYDVETGPAYTLPDGKKIHFYPSPFLHFPGAFTTYDEASGLLFSGDIWAALDTEWQLIVPSFQAHIPKLDLFHKDYIPANRAARGFVHSIEHLDIRGILPQHGSLIRREHVPEALSYLRELECGLDLVYSDMPVGPYITEDDRRNGESSEQIEDIPDPYEDSQIRIQSENELLRKTQLMDEALRQSARLANLRDRALHELRAAEQRLDGLLRIPNRRSFESYFQQEWQRAMRHKSPISLMMIDVDHFKMYNDYYGHQAGDDCLIRMAKAIEGCMRRSTDMAARYGGEEFVCLLPDTSLEGAIPVAREIMQAAAREKIKHSATPVSDYVTLSIGIASVVPAADMDPGGVMEWADAHLYDAKTSGRNRIVSDKGVEAF